VKEFIKTNWIYITAGATVLSIVCVAIWKISAYVTENNIKTGKIDKIEIKIDSLGFKFDLQNDKIKNYVEKVDKYSVAHDALQRSVILYWQDNINETKKYMKYAEGLQMQVLDELKKNMIPIQLIPK